MRVSGRSNLRLVGHAEHLAVLAERTQAGTDRCRNRATDAGVDLVEDHGRHRVQPLHGHLDRQRYARQFAARGDPAQGTWRLPRIGRHQKFGAFAAVGIRRGGVADRVQRHLEATCLHAQAADQQTDVHGQAVACRQARSAERIGRNAPLSHRLCNLGAEALHARAGIGQRVQFHRQGIAMCRQPLCRYPMLSGQVLHPRQASFDVEQGLGIEVEVVADPLQHAGRFIQLDCGRVEHAFDLAKPGLMGGLALQCSP